MFGLRRLKIFTVPHMTVKDKLTEALGVFNTAKTQLQEVVFSANTEIKEKEELVAKALEEFERVKKVLDANIEKSKQETDALQELKVQAQNIMSNIDALTNNKIQIVKDEEDDGRNC